MEIRQKEEGNIRKDGISIRKIDSRIRTTGKAVGNGSKLTARGVRNLTKAGIDESKYLMRSKDIRMQLKTLSPEQQKQWRSYSYRRQTKILNKAERLSVKATERKLETMKHPKARFLAYQLNRQAKGSRISNAPAYRGQGDKWTVETQTGEPKTFYTEDATKGLRKTQRIQNRFQKAVRREKKENTVQYRSAVFQTLDKDLQRSRQIRQMQKEDYIDQNELERMTATQAVTLTFLPIRTKVNLVLRKVAKRVSNITKRAALKFFLPLMLPILIFVLLIGSILPMLGGAPESGSGANSNGGQQLVAMALSQLGEQGGQPYWSYLGYSGRVAWCASFVSWCANECGFVASGIIPKTAWCDDFRDTYKQKNAWHDGKAHGGNYTPQAGDLILFDWNSSTVSSLDHVGIVKASDGTRVFTIEGNSGDAVREQNYSLDYSCIIGYGSPAYPASALVGGNNAEQIFNYLTGNCGFSKAAAAGVVGNLYAEGGTTADGDINIHATEGNGEGVGMVQWSFGRKTAFLNYCSQRGQPWPNTGLNIQIDFMVYEFNSGGWLWSSIGAEYGSQCNISTEAFKQLTDVAFATRVWCAKFERCHLYNSNLESTRIPKAMGMFQSH